jgi:signal peptidase II
MLRERRLELVIVLVVLILDQVTKMLVRNSLELHESIVVVPEILSLTRVHNTGAAFGMLNGVDFAFKTLVMSLVAVAALGGVGWYAISVPVSDVMARVGIAGVVGGAIGNLVDRFARGDGLIDGPVIDWIELWIIPTFNLADASVTLAVALLLIQAWRNR